MNGPAPPARPAPHRSPRPRRRLTSPLGIRTAPPIFADWIVPSEQRRRTLAGERANAPATSRTLIASGLPRGYGHTQTIPNHPVHSGIVCEPNGLHSSACPVPRVRSVVGVPHARAQRTPPPAAPAPAEPAEPERTHNTHFGRPTPADAEALRGLPAIGYGIGSGAIKGRIPGATNPGYRMPVS